MPWVTMDGNNAMCLLGYVSLPFHNIISCQGAIGAAVRNLESLGNRDLTMPPKKEPTKHQTFPCWMLGEGFWANITGKPHDVGQNCRDWNFKHASRPQKRAKAKVSQWFVGDSFGKPRL